MALKSLRLHFLRSVLAAVGVLIGVTAVIWLVALGEGVSYQAQQLIKEYGATNVIIRSKAPPVAGDTGRVKIYGLTRLDFERITARIAGPSSPLVINTIERAVPMREVSMEVRYFDRTCDVQLLGIMKDYQEINHLEMDLGRFLSLGDSRNKSNICVLAYGTALDLFPFENPLGKTIRLDQDFYRSVHLIGAHGQPIEALIFIEVTPGTIHIALWTLNLRQSFTDADLIAENNLRPIHIEHGTTRLLRGVGRMNIAALYFPPQGFKHLAHFQVIEQLSVPDE
jgi:hypothetical protein